MIARLLDVMIYWTWRKIRLKRFIIYGFTLDEVSSMKKLVSFVSRSIEYITIQNNDFEVQLEEVVRNRKFKIDSDFDFDEKVIIFDGILLKELNIYYKILKLKLSKKIIFAKTTESSLKMRIKDLFNEFKMERKFLKKNNK